MDSTGTMQEQAQPPADSLGAAQEDVASRDDGNSRDRINGLMRLVGKRTTEARQQEARATQAETALADALERLKAYETGARMSDDEAQEQETLIQPGDDTDGDITPGDTDDADITPADDEEREERAEALRAGWPQTIADLATMEQGAVSDSYWVPDNMQPTLMDPNSASRASSLRIHTPGETARLRSDFDRHLDDALVRWGVEDR